MFKIRRRILNYMIFKAIALIKLLGVYRDIEYISTLIYYLNYYRIFFILIDETQYQAFKFNFFNILY
jgi:hypothetical protein